MTVEFKPPQWARNMRPAAVLQTGSAAPKQYAPIKNPPPIYDVVSHGAQYGQGRRYGVVRPSLIVFHTTENASLNNTLVYDMRRPETVGQTVVYGEGKLCLTTPYEHRPWTQGRWNDGALSVEIVGRAAWTRSEWLATEPNVVADMARLLKHWWDEFRIPPQWLSADQIAVGASRSGETPWRPMGSLPGVCDHLEANRAAVSLGHSASKYSHHDVGVGMRSLLIGDIIPAAVKLVTPTPPEPEPEPESEETMKPSHLKRYPKIGVFNGDTLLLTTDDELKNPDGSSRIQGGKVVGGPYDGCPIIDSDPETDTQFATVLERNGAQAAYLLGKRASG